MATNEEGQNPWECWVCQTKGRTIRSLLKQLQTPKDQARTYIKVLTERFRDRIYKDYLL